MRDIKALLFDIDGTVIDTREYILQAFEYSLSKHGIDIPNREIIGALIGKPLDEIYRDLTSLEDTSSFEKAHGEFQLNNLHLSKVYPNTVFTLRTLKNRGFRLAAVTSRFKETVLETLKKEDMLDAFEYIVFGDQLPEIKPHPAPLFKALEILETLPSQAIMIGDSDVDIEAGKNAGTGTIRATYGFNINRLHETNPDFIVDDIVDLIDILK